MKVPGATPFQDKLKEYELKAPTVGMFGEISKDGESILEIAAWKRADEYCTFLTKGLNIDSDFTIYLCWILTGQPANIY